MTGLFFHTDCWFRLAASAGVMDWPGLLGGRHPRTSTSFSFNFEAVMDCQRHRFCVARRTLVLANVPCSYSQCGFAPWRMGFE